MILTWTNKQPNKKSHNSKQTNQRRGGEALQLISETYNLFSLYIMNTYKWMREMSKITPPRTKWRDKKAHKILLRIYSISFIKDGVYFFSNQISKDQKIDSTRFGLVYRGKYSSIVLLTSIIDKTVNLKLL